MLWWRQDDPRLPHKWDAFFNNSGEHEILFSLVSIWEISIKRRIGKLQMDGATEDFARTLVTEHGFRQISLELHEVCRSERLPLHHRDPFDRLLIAQAIELGATAVTDDLQWQQYPIKVEF
ncbi:MAG: type II toxin-antitoxin system VapC family toxin [Opitutales bacterium]